MEFSTLDVSLDGNVATSTNPTVPPNMGCVGDPTCLGSTFTISTLALNLANANAIRTNIGSPGVNASAVPQGAGTGVRGTTVSRHARSASMTAPAIR